jgi:hypothetical protein
LSDAFAFRFVSLASPSETPFRPPHGGAMLGKESMSNAKQEVEQLLNKLPDDCSVEDIQYHLYVLDKVRRGLEDARLNGTLSQQEVEIRPTIDTRYDDLKSGA